MKIITLIVTLFFGTVIAYAQPAPFAKSDFRDAMDKLWEDDVTWTRLYIVSAAANLPDKDATAQRLLQNQADLGNAIKPVYGEAAGDKLTTLLKDHIVISTEIIDAAKAGDTAKKDEAANRWNANADEIATFLSAANSKNWPVAEMKKMMREHLDLTTAEVVAPFARRLGRGYRGLRESSHADSENGRHVECRNYQTVSE